jgi:ubiquinone/menaquinone biosynthesis C-methylase UbiE
MSLFLKILIHIVFTIHSKSYNWGSRLASKYHGKNPKHWIIKYEEWFLDQIHENSNIIDVGSNTGALPIALSKKASSIHAIEINQNLYHQGKNKTKNLKNITYHHADATTFNYEELEETEFVTLSNVLEHIENRIEFLSALIEKVKWKGGEARFLIRVPSIEREWPALYKKEQGWEYRLDYTHFIEYTEKEILEELRTVGLKVRNIKMRFGEFFIVCDNLIND